MMMNNSSLSMGGSKDNINIDLTGIKLKNNFSTGSKSYDEYLTYGTGEQKYHYICHFIGVLKDDNGKSRSLSLKQINDSECGGWDAIIPENASVVPKGKRIFEFTDRKVHREKSKLSVKENPFIYKTHYPGYQNPERHPDNLCVPCCYQNLGFRSTIW